MNSLMIAGDADTECVHVMIIVQIYSQVSDNQDQDLRFIAEMTTG